MGKYSPLTAYLQKCPTYEVPMTFEEVMRVIGSDLPPSAYKHRPWWANETTGHIHAKAWLVAGYETTQVDMEGKKLVFKRVAPPTTPPPTTPSYATRGLAEDKHEFTHPNDNKPPRRHPAFGALKGTFTIEPGWDLTKPAMDPDELAEWEANIERKADLVEQGMKGKRP
jgi:hypothetical protein